MVHLIVAEKYETIDRLRNYSVEEFLALFEIVFVQSTNKAIEMLKIKREAEMKKR